MLNIAICDDEIYAVKLIHNEVRELFEKNGKKVNISCYKNGKNLGKDILKGVYYDVLFLDIQMPDIDGIKLAEYLRKTGNQCLIIFVSSREDEVFRSIAVTPFRFVRKDKFTEEIEATVHAIIKTLDKNRNAGIPFRSKDKIVRVDPANIMYIESNNRIQTIHQEGKSFEVYYTLCELEKMLEDYGFIKIHRSFLVNIKYVYSVHKTDLSLDNGTLLPISKHRIKDIKNELLK